MRHKLFARFSLLGKQKSRVRPTLLWSLVNLILIYAFRHLPHAVSADHYNGMSTLHLKDLSVRFYIKAVVETDNFLCMCRVAYFAFG